MLAGSGTVLMPATRSGRSRQHDCQVVDVHRAVTGELALAPSARLVVMRQHDGQVVDVHLAVRVRVAGHDLIDPHIV